MVPSDSTMVTGSPTAARTPRTGDVLGERWEIRATISTDGLYATYRGTDQETNQNVLVRVIGVGRLSERDAQRMAARLRLLVGMGGPVLSPIREVDHEGARLFVIEKFPDGASFRSVLDTRRAKNQLFTPAELLPLVAHVSSALAAINDPWFHGDVRAERIYVGPERVLLTGGFALSVMSGDIVRETLSADGTLRGELAPEAAEGAAGAAADRWGVAALVWEALTGTRPREGHLTPPAALGELGALLSRYLNRDASARPHSLEPLVSMLAARAKTPVPRTTPESFAVHEPAPDDRTELAHRPDPSLSSESMALLLSEVNDTPSPSDTAKHVALDERGTPRSDRPKKGDLSDIDPALLEAARASRSLSDSGTFNLEAEELKALETQGKGKTTTSSSELDPRLVRAALGVSLEEPSSITESSEMAVPVAPRSAPARPAPQRMQPKPKPANTTQEIDASDLEVVVSRRKPIEMAPVAVSAVPTPSDLPRPMSLDSAETFVGPKVSSPQVVPSARPQLGRAQVVSAPASARSITETPVVPQPLSPKVASVPPASRSEAPRGAAPSSISGNAIIAVAVAVALFILGAAFFYRHVQENTAREHRIDERLRELRHDP